MFANEIENKTVLTVISKPVSRPLFVVGKYLGISVAIAVAFFLLSTVLALTIRHRVMSTASDHFDIPVLLFGIGGALIAIIFATAANYLYNKVFTSTLTVALLVTQTVALMLVLLINKRWGIQSPLTEFTAHHGELTQVVIGVGAGLPGGAGVDRCGGGRVDQAGTGNDAADLYRRVPAWFGQQFAEPVG